MTGLAKRHRNDARVQAQAAVAPARHRLLWLGIATVVIALALAGYWLVGRDTRPVPRTADANVLAVVQQAQTLYDAGKVDDGIAMVRAQIEAHPDAPLLHYTLGVFMLARNDLESARKEFEAEIATNPGYAGSYTQIGLAYSRLGDVDNSIVSFETALRLKPDDLDAAFYLGRSLSTAGRYEEAEKQLRAAARSGRAPALSELGLVLRKLGRNDEAIETFQQALAADPWDLVARLNLGQLLVASGRAADGELVLRRHAAMSAEFDQFDRFRRSSLLAGASSGNLVNLGNAYLQREEYPEALRSFQRAIEIDPGDPDGPTGVAEVLLLTGRANEVDPWIGRSLQADPANSKARFVLGLSQLQRGNVEAGVRALEASQGAGAWDATMYARAADAFRVAGRTSDATTAGREAVRRDGRDPASYRALGLALLANGDAAGALAVLQKGVSVAPDDPDLYMSMGVVDVKLGDRTGAEQAFREALRIQRVTVFGEENLRRAVGIYLALPESGPAMDLYRQLKGT